LVKASTPSTCRLSAVGIPRCTRPARRDVERRYSPAPGVYDFTDKVTFVIGGTRSFGTRLAERVLADHAPKAVAVTDAA
jgi:FlaA1/EpsC-like NDP-sugar epimerase